MQETELAWLKENYLGWIPITMELPWLDPYNEVADGDFLVGHDLGAFFTRDFAAGD